MKIVITIAVCVLLVGCGVMQANSYCGQTIDRQKEAYVAIKMDRLTIDAAEERLRAIGPVSNNWKFFLSSMRSNPRIEWDVLKPKLEAYCQDDFFAEKPVTRTKEEQYCYEISQTCSGSEVKKCEDTCNIQMRAARKYLGTR